MSKSKPVFVSKANCEEGWDDDHHGTVQWCTLFSADRTPTDSLTAGVAEINPGQQLNLHRHQPSELYYILSGQGIVTIDTTDYEVEANTAVFIPGFAEHGIRNTGQGILRFFYAFAVDSFAQITYLFSDASDKLSSSGGG